MKQKVIMMLALLCAVAQGAWAETSVSDETSLRNAITDGATNIQLTADIQLSNYLNIEGVTVTIDLNGHKLYRDLSSSSDAGNVIWIHNNGNLTIADYSSTHSGSIEGGKATNGGGINVWPGCSLNVNNVTFKDNSASDNGGAIFVRNGANVILTTASFIGNTASDHAGAIWNNGELTAMSCTFTNNIASDVGGIYNSVTADGAGTATLTRCTFTRNRGYAGAGALANALGATVMTIDGCTIENNTAYQYGGGIWNGGTLNVKGEVKVTGNKNDDGMFSNLYLKAGKVITVTGNLTGSNIGVEMENATGTFTNGYITYHGGVDPSNFFSADRLNVVGLDLDDKGEVSLVGNIIVNYIERSWDAINKQVASTEERLTGLMIGDDATPTVEGQYKEVTNAPASSPNEWFGMGGYSNNFPEFYVVRGNVNRETVVVQGKNVHLILCDGATLTLTGGLKLEGDNKLYIHCQSYGSDMGRLMVTNKYDDAAGIGSARHNFQTVKVGELVIYGGHIEATGGKYGAGIGSCGKTDQLDEDLCNRVTVYGGYVKAQGGEHGAGIGGGDKINGGDFILYDGTVIANGGGGLAMSYNSNGGYGMGTFTPDYPIGGGAGVGGGGNGSQKISGYGGNVTVYGGTLTATGGGGGAGIGSAHFDADYINRSCGGTFKIYGGTVTATGGGWGAGIGGGYQCGGAEVFIYGGTVTATGGVTAAGIGGGGSDLLAGGGGGFGCMVLISGGTVTATGGEDAAGIGGGDGGDGGNVTITGGTVIAKAGTQGGTGNRAIGPGSGSNDYGTLTIDDPMMVGAGNNASVESIFDADERKNACWFRSYAEVSPCTHPSGVTYTINEDGTHTTHCKHCSLSETEAHFNSDSTDPCICGYKNGESYCTITLATSSNGTSYEGVGITANVGNNKPYTLPVCSSIPEGYDFAGWVVNPQSQANGIRPNEGETLLAANSEYIVTASVSIFARYKDIVINLADDNDNAETLYNYNGKEAASVTLAGRTLYKDGNWNTLCLPFSLTEDQLAAQLAPGELKTLASSEFADGTLTLTFEDASEIEAGKPYIIKWPNDTEHPTIVGPTFTDVTISDAYTPVETDVVDFVGTFSPIDIFTEEKTNLYLGANNTLYYPAGEDMTTFTVNAFRSYFELKYGLTAGEPTEPTSPEQGIKAFVLNFGEETGIEEVHGDGLWVHGYGPGWCTLDGRRLDGKPTAKGIYIFEGRKVLIK